MSFLRSLALSAFAALAIFSLSSCSAQTSTTDGISYEKDTITLYGPVNTNSAERVVRKLHELQDKSKKPIYLFIDSPGGQVFAGSKIIDAMMASKRPVYTVDVGTAASMAAFIHSYGVKRYMLPHSVIMFHNASSEYSGDVIHIKSELQLISQFMDQLNANVVERTGVPLKELKEKEGQEWWILAEEALSRHFVDEVKPMDFPSKEIN